VGARTDIEHPTLLDLRERGEESHLRILYAYSPLHNIRPGVVHPTLMLVVPPTV